MSYIIYNGKLITKEGKYVNRISQLDTQGFDHFENINFNTLNSSGFAISSAIADNSVERRIRFLTSNNSADWTPGLSGTYQINIARTGYVLNSGNSPWLYAIIDGYSSFGYSLGSYANFTANGISLNSGSIINFYFSNFVYDDMFPDPPFATNFSLTNLVITIS